MQTKLGRLDEYRASSWGEDRATLITVVDVMDAIACTLPKDERTTAKFCDFMFHVAHYAKSAGCDVILQAGGIPVLFDGLRLWPSVKDVVYLACLALNWLANQGSAPVKSAMRSILDCEALLIAAHESKLDRFYEGIDGYAAATLDQLGFGAKKH